jgi:hypothetical protein
MRADDGRATPRVVDNTAARGAFLGAGLHGLRVSRGVNESAKTRRVCRRAIAEQLTTSNADFDYEVSTKIPSAAARLWIWCAVRRSIISIVPPQRGHGHDADGAVSSTGVARV